LIENPKERMLMGKNGRKRIIAEFSPEAVEKKIMKVYDEVLKNRK
jgi:glycosyltransferase involved in cell wall biosynthesis